MRLLSRAFACSLLLSPALAADSWAEHKPQMTGGRKDDDYDEAWSRNVAKLDDEAWSRNVARLKAYSDERGDCNVPADWDDSEGGFRLGAWVSSQKQEWEKYEEDPSTSQLTARRFQDLQSVGAIFDWLEADLKRRMPDRLLEWEEELMSL